MIATVNVKFAIPPNTKISMIKWKDFNHWVRSLMMIGIKSKLIVPYTINNSGTPAIP